jgi:hypothetical protein
MVFFFLFLVLDYLSAKLWDCKRIRGHLPSNEAIGLSNRVVRKVQTKYSQGAHNPNTTTLGMHKGVLYTCPLYFYKSSFKQEYLAAFFSSRFNVSAASFSSSFQQAFSLFSSKF